MNTNEDPGQTNKYIHNFLKVIVNLWVFAVQVFHLLFIFKHFHNKILGGGISAYQKRSLEEGQK